MTHRGALAWARLFAGLWLFAAGVVLGLRSGLGLSPWDVLHDGIRQVTPLSFGAATVLVGVVLVALGSALYIGAGLGSGPRDSLMLAISARTRARVDIVRALIEAGVLAVGWLLGGAAGVGTILFAFGIGPAVELAFRLLRVELPATEDRGAGGRERACAGS